MWYHPKPPAPPSTVGLSTQLARVWRHVFAMALVSYAAYHATRWWTEIATTRIGDDTMPGKKHRRRDAFNHHSHVSNEIARHVANIERHTALHHRGRSVRCAVVELEGLYRRVMTHLMRIYSGRSRHDASSLSSCMLAINAYDASVVEHAGEASGVLSPIRHHADNAPVSVRRAVDAISRYLIARSEIMHDIARRCGLPRVMDGLRPTQPLGGCGSGNLFYQHNMQG